MSGASLQVSGGGGGAPRKQFVYVLRLRLINIKFFVANDVESSLAASNARNSEKCVCGNNNPYASFGATQAWDEEKNLWSAPHDISHTEADDDRILYNLIVVRDRLEKDSEVRPAYTNAQ
ncbi:hypothetical protein JD844_023319 [Phrynosoma platyrhinos]|uniref:Uncharacterized protein n=1 Tax=Phrynosoma platyrhinos TaxID=52577 RepID=A0ABQ7SWB0_PHRPL|nr:hypothetical protein JD844_023319 [Phrynosoma platyrhinos]